MTVRWRGILVVLLLASCFALVGLASGSWIRWYEQDDEVHVGTVLEMDREFWLIGTSISSFDPPEAGILVFRIDPAGNLNAPLSYDWNGVQSAADALVTADGDVFYAGQTDQYGAVGSDMYVLRTDRSRQTLAEWVLGESLEESAVRIVLGSQGDLFVVGNQVNPDDVIADPETAGYGGLEGRAAPYVARIQPDGGPMWKRDYATEDNVVVFDAAPTSTGGCYLLSTVYGFPEEDDAIRLDRLDENGTVMWSRTFAEGNSKGYSLLPLPSGRLMIAGARGDAEGGKPQALLMLLEATGREVWSRTFGASDRITTAHALVQNEDGLIVAAGTQFEDYAEYEDDVYLLCVDENGERQWEQTFPTDKHVMVEALRERAGGGLLIAGTGAGGGERFQAMLLFVDPTEEAGTPSAL